MAESPDEVDLGGDTYLLVETADHRTRIKVSSTLLSVASPYFGTGFKEGTQAVEGKDVEVQEEKIALFVMLCEILHMQYELPLHPLKSEDVFNFAAVVDKYSCARAVSLPSVALFPLTAADMGCNNFEVIGRFIIAAYLLNQPQMFYH